MLDYFKNKPNKEYHYKEEEFLMCADYGLDSPTANVLKKESQNNYKNYYDILRNTNCYNYSRNLHNCYQQLLHATQINTGPKTFYTYNCGLDNLIVIVAMSYNKVSGDDGKPFMSVVKTKTPELYNNGFFGKNI